jgi:hypothetical protein
VKQHRRMTQTGWVESNMHLPTKFKQPGFLLRTAGNSINNHKRLAAFPYSTVPVHSTSNPISSDHIFTVARPAKASFCCTTAPYDSPPTHAKPSPRLALLLLSHCLELLLPLLQLTKPLSQLHCLELSLVEGVERVPLLPPQLQNLVNRGYREGTRIQGFGSPRRRSAFFLKVVSGLVFRV